jgi:trans-aconitate methyltransferase
LGLTKSPCFFLITLKLQLSRELSNMLERTTKKTSGFRVVDLCCGVGFSTRALRDAFPQPDTTVIGIDTSPQMVRRALRTIALLL